MNNCVTENHDKIKEKLNNSSNYIEAVKGASNFFSLLGDESRMKIVLALLEGELCVYHICEITGCKQSAVSQHLRKLRDNHIVKVKKVGNQMLYSIEDEHIFKAVKIALEHMGCKD